MLKPITRESTATSTAGSPSSKAGRENRYCVVAYEGGQFVGVMSGMGRNRGTWDSSHCRRSAQRHAAALRVQRPAQTFHVETN